jgi:hypothetical protein
VRILGSLPEEAERFGRLVSQMLRLRLEDAGIESGTSARSTSTTHGAKSRTTYEPRRMRKS